MKIAVKFCGNCSPRIDAWELYQDIVAALPGDTVGPWKDDAPPDALLVLNSCRSACAGMPAFAGPRVVAAPDNVDRWPVTEEELPDAILRALEAVRKEVE